MITIKKDKSVKIALDPKKLNEITIERKAQMPNMEELVPRISRKIADGAADEIQISKFDLDYQYGLLQTNLKESNGTKHICSYRGEFSLDTIGF